MDPQKEYDRLVKTMEETGLAKASKMFGMPCLKNLNGKAFAGYTNGEVILKLPQNIIQQWVGNQEAKLFEPMIGRPMKEWLQLSADYADHWQDLAKEALEFVNKKSKK